MAIAALHHVLVTAPPHCEEEARRFFGGLLGLPEIPKPEQLLRSGGVWFELGSQQLHVGCTRDFRPERKGHPAFSVPDEAALAELAERLVFGGSPVHWDDRLPGVPRFYTEDPWGNRIEVLAPPRE
jgi:catechol 2,3-dioxygenase-like lactoylglutathione lyase family enzyme